MSKSQSTKASTATLTGSNNVFDKIEKWGVKNDSKLLFTFLTLTLILSVMHFNARISEAHDDALYLEGGWRYVNEFPNYFYTQNAPLYVLFLGLLTKLFGFKLLLFKLFNVVFNFFAVFFFFKAFHKRIPYIVLIPVMVFVSCNHLIQYYASMTFTEAFYLFLQSLFFYSFFKLYDALQIESNGRKHLKLFLMLGLFTFLIATCKSGAIVAVPVVILFFALEKQWLNAALAFAGYLAVKIPYEILVKLIWGSQNQFSGQGKILLQKDPYDKSLGNEDLAGFIGRFFDNCNLYLGKRFYELLGLREELTRSLQSQEEADKLTKEYKYLAFFLVAILLLSLYKVFKQKNKPMIFFGLFTAAQLFLSFVILQARWDQPRIVLISMPVMLILIYLLFFNSVKKSGMGQNLYLAIALMLSLSVFLSSFKRGAANVPIVKKNLSGNIYYGYTPDWQNFLRCSAWCADSLPQNSLVASRKAPMSFVYGKGKKFFPIYSVIMKDSLTQQSNPDSALAHFASKGVTHIMVGSLRINPKENTGQVINTVHNIVQPIMEKYPNKLKLIHTEGLSEQSYLFEITK
ncbi:MAG: hypothetical protein K0R26_1781 [Bacteroidota bacterium]|jgi:hypothetical protein|nr:hypothetical protein [Bacteroidota bacterium]